MFEKDYIMREVQKLVQVLKVILGLKHEGKHDEALAEINDSYRRYFDEDSRAIQAEGHEGLVLLCSRDGRFLPDLAFALADLIKEEATILEIEGEEQRARQKYELALGLYQRARVENKASIPINIATKIQQLKGKLN